MDIAALSMVLSQSRTQEAAGISLTKITMDAGKENSIQMTEMINDLCDFLS